MYGAGLLLLLLAELLYLFTAFRSWGNGWADPSLFVAFFALQFFIVWRASRLVSLSPRILIAGAVLFRLTLLPAGFESGEWQRFQLYDSDIWRYLWDGHVIASGLNPYLNAPRDAALDALATDSYWTNVRENVNYGYIPTIYPPAAQAVFALAHPFGVAGIKIAVVIFDLLALWFLILTLRILKRPMTDALWYAWNPLVIKVFAGSGHIDSLAVAGIAAMFYAMALGSQRGSTVAYLTAVLTKWSPLVLLPLLLTPLRRIHPAALLLLLPVAAIPNVFEGASAFAGFWQFNGVPYGVLLEVFRSPMLAKAAAAVIVLATLFLPKGKEGDLQAFARQTGYTLGALVVLSPAVMPWYVTWLLPSAILGRDHRWIAFSGLVFLAFFVMVDGQERWWITGAEYGVLLCVLSWTKAVKSEDFSIAPRDVGGGAGPG